MDEPCQVISVRSQRIKINTKGPVGVRSQFKDDVESNGNVSNVTNKTSTSYIVNHILYAVSAASSRPAIEQHIATNNEQLLQGRCVTF